jgi:hypothetical protein
MSRDTELTLKKKKKDVLINQVEHNTTGYVKFQNNREKTKSIL